jgi:hypothetical protein
VQGAEFGWIFGGECIHDCAGLVVGAVVDGEDLEVGIVLLQERLEAGGDVRGFVAGRDDDGERGAVEGAQVVLLQRNVGDAGKAASGGECLPCPGQGDEPGDGDEGELEGVGQDAGSGFA